MSGIQFMGEQEDPELQVWIGRGLRVYDSAKPVTVRSRTPMPSAKSGALFVHQDGRWVRCGCGRCFTGPCPVPMEANP